VFPVSPLGALQQARPMYDTVGRNMPGDYMSTSAQLSAGQSYSSNMVTPPGLISSSRNLDVSTTVIVFLPFLALDLNFLEFIDRIADCNELNNCPANVSIADVWQWIQSIAYFVIFG